MSRHQTAKTEVIPAQDALEQDWQNAQNIIGAIDLHTQLALLGQVLLGWHLSNIKASLGFAGRGRPKKFAGDRELRANLTWREHVEANLQVPSTGKPMKGPTADVYILVFESAKRRLKNIGEEAAIKLLDGNPNEIKGKRLEDLRKLVTKVTDGATQKELLEDLALVKAKAKPTGGNLGRGSDERYEPTLREEAFLAMTGPFRDFVSLRENPERWRAWIHALPRHAQEEMGEPFGLLDLPAHLELIQEDIKAVLKQ